MFHEFRSNPTQTLFLVRISIYIYEICTQSFAKFLLNVFLGVPGPRLEMSMIGFFHFVRSSFVNDPFCSFFFNIQIN